MKTGWEGFMIYISNAFSLSMLDNEDAHEGVYLHVQEVGIPIVRTWLARYDWTSCVGHADTARLISNILGVEIPTNRVSVTLSHNDFVFVAQYAGPRLPEGSTTLPEGAELRFLMVGFFEIGL